jgi:glycosyltransferase involved in cell wall biosynthesis
VRQRLAAKIKVPVEHIFTVGNTYNAAYDAFKPDEADSSILPDLSGTFNLVCISGSFEHKNLDVLNRVIPELKRIGVDNVRFILTIEDEKMEHLFSAQAREKIFNTGPVSVADCPILYHKADAVFLPTLLECFSANYPEAMKMERPLVTSGMSFAKTICANAALYFDPVDPVDIASKIKLLMDNSLLRKELVENGKKVLATLNTAEIRAQKYLELCEYISNQYNQK